MPVELTQRRLRIPAAVARTLARGDERLYDELLSVAGLALANAARAYDPARDLKGCPESWLYAVVLRQCVRALPAVRGECNSCTVWGTSRRAARRGQPLLADPADPRGGHEAAVEAADLVEALLADLPPAERAVVLARALGRTFEEIAAETGHKKQAAQNRHARACARLRALWTPDGQRV